MKKNKLEKQFLDELRKVPIIQVACEKVGLSRQSIYRWRKEDKEFAKKMDQAMEDGVAFVNDMSESQLLQLIKDKTFSAIRFWLNSRHPKYKKKIEVDYSTKEESLTPEQELIVKKALNMVSVNNEKKHE